MNISLSYHLGITKFACALWREGGFDVDVSAEGVTETLDHRKISMDCEGMTKLREMMFAVGLIDGEM